MPGRSGTGPPVDDPLSGQRALVDSLTGDGQPGQWELARELPLEVLRKLGAGGILCAEVPTGFGGLGATSADNGRLTAHVGELCSSLRSIMTSQGIAAWTIQRFGDREQQRRYLAELTSGQLAAVGFSEPAAGSDLSAMQTRIRTEDGFARVSGQKKWVTGAQYADLLLVLGKHEEGAAAVVVPSGAPGVHIEPVADPMGCRAAGHAHVRLDDVRLPVSALLGGGNQPLALLFTTALSYGRMSVAWGCVGIIRACLAAAASHAKRREQGGKALAGHQLIGRHLAELVIAEQTSSRVCEHASRAWGASSPDMVVAAVLAKHVSAGHAARSAATAVQVLGSAAAEDGHVLARAYRDAKLMEIIEGSNEICQLILAEHAVATSA